jgi:hypothetical protein
MAFVGAIALGLFIGSYAITRNTSNAKPVPQSDGPPLAIAPVAAPEVEAGGGGVVVAPPVTGSPWAVVSVEPTPSRPVAVGGGGGGGHHSSRPPKQVVAPAPGPAPVAPPPAAHKDDCEPPYTLDSDGTRKYKTWCPGVAQ